MKWDYVVLDHIVDDKVSRNTDLLQTREIKIDIIC